MSTHVIEELFRHVHNALSREQLLGQEVLRVGGLSGNQLVVEVAVPEGHGVLVAEVVEGNAHGHLKDTGTNKLC